MIHPTAVIDASARLGQNVKIGPFCLIGANVEIGDDTVLESHVVLKGPTKIGKANHFYQFTSIGEDCQDKKYKGEATELVIGDNNVFRENCTVHRGTVQDQGVTRIGSHNLFMNNTHVAHDCVIGDNVIFASGAQAAGHVHVGDWVILGGMSGIHQFCHIGAHSFIGGGSIVVKDVPPYLMAHGSHAVPAGLNVEGLKRRGFSADAILEVRRAYKEVYRKGLTVQEALEVLADKAAEFAEVKLFTDFIANSSRGIIR
ncbi:acyl-ACP--UDP-N-acetylglucosamine O-acyltransferase [Rheinheimera marina]|uniref:Acyl-[acyl-carrier-protein]--UDP-N-acetylglucosamine O-acyltransferase n=1 Tax=Rheinheimera marina TaxID=1774958 RepID=A0ABV9JKU1_9GAMM